MSQLYLLSVLVKLLLITLLNVELRATAQQIFSRHQIFSSQHTNSHQHKMCSIHHHNVLLHVKSAKQQANCVSSPMDIESQADSNHSTTDQSAFEDT